MIGEIHNAKEWLRALKSHIRVVIDCYGQKCPPCEEIAPKIEKLAMREKNVSFFKFDINDDEAHADSYGIDSVPRFLFFFRGRLQTDLTVEGANFQNVLNSLDRLKCNA